MEYLTLLAKVSVYHTIQGWQRERDENAPAPGRGCNPGGADSFFARCAGRAANADSGEGIRALGLEELGPENAASAGTSADDGFSTNKAGW